MALSSDDVRQLYRHLDAARRALQRLPPPEPAVVTNALAAVEAVRKAFASSPQGDPSAALKRVSDTAHALASYAITNSAKGVKDDVDVVIKQLHDAVAMLRSSIDPARG